MEVTLPPPKTTVFAGSPWGGQKTIWAIRPGTSRLLTVRGVRLDAPGEVRFEEGVDPPSKIFLGPQTSEWAYIPTYTRLRAHGCYAFIVEAPGVLHYVVFRANGEPRDR